MTLTQWALLAFTLVSLAGMLMAVRVLSGGQLHWLVRKGHRFVAVFALATLAIAGSRGIDTPMSWVAFAVLVATFLAGLICFGVWLRGRSTPPILIFGHGFLGLSGLVLLAMAAL